MEKCAKHNHANVYRWEAETHGTTSGPMCTNFFGHTVDERGTW